MLYVNETSQGKTECYGRLPSMAMTESSLLRPFVIGLRALIASYNGDGVVFIFTAVAWIPWA